MSKVSQMAFLIDLQQSESTFDLESVARKALNLLSCSKTWADNLHVTPQQINLWKGSDSIPLARQEQIIHQAKLFLLELHEFEGEIDRLIFGRK